MTQPFVHRGNAAETLASVNISIYGTTTYMSSFKDPVSVKKPDDIREPKKKLISKRVRFSEKVEKVESIPPENEVLDNESEVDEITAPKEETGTQNDAVGRGSVNKDETCQICGKIKVKKGQLNILGAREDVTGYSSSFPDDRPAQKRAARHTVRNKTKEHAYSYPKMFMNARPKRLSNVYCECEKYQHLKDSLLKAEAVARRRAESFARRNFTTISVFHLLKNEANAAKKQQFRRRGNHETITKEPRINEWNRDYKSDANRRFHVNFPQGAPDLRDSMRNVRRVIFCGHRSQVFR